MFHVYHCTVWNDIINVYNIYLCSITVAAGMDDPATSTRISLQFSLIWEFVTHLMEKHHLVMSPSQVGSLSYSRRFINVSHFVLPLQMV